MKYLILDIDGTLCHTPEGLSVSEFHKLDHSRFAPKRDVIDKIYIKYPHQQLEVIYLTARCQSLYFTTRTWLNKHCEDLHKNTLHLFMRPTENLESAEDLKIKTLKSIGIEPNNVILWLDDDSGVLNWGNKSGYNVVHPNKFLTGVSL